jgi:hypothetical protein
MSSLPGLTLEELVAWNFNVVVTGPEPIDSNWSLRAAETLGTIPPRRRLSPVEFAPVVAIYEPVRAEAERLLAAFDPETQSWRDYGYYCFDNVLTDERADEAMNYLNALPVSADTAGMT